MPVSAPVARFTRALPLALVLVVLIFGARPAPASAGVCGAIGFFGGWAGRACTVVSHPSKLIKAGKSLATGHPGKAVKTFFSSGSGSKALGLAALVTWVTGGAKTALTATAKVISKTTRPQLRTTWFSATYWRIAGIAAVLTLPFLFAAAVQAILRSDLALLSRAAFGYLPLSLLAVSIAAPLAMLLLSATDEMSSVVSSAAGDAGGHFLGRTGLYIGALSLIGRSPFLVFMIALFTAAAAIVLWIEMLMREAAVYIVVLMLPLAFAALVWPARRIWAARSAELLVALILSKFAIVAVLALGAAALGHGGGGGGMLMGLVLVTLAAFAPWALLRLLPMAELASSAAGHLRGEASRIERVLGGAESAAYAGADWAGSVVSGMRRQARDAADMGADGADVRSTDAVAASHAAASTPAAEVRPSEDAGVAGEPGEAPEVDEPDDEASDDAAAPARSSAAAAMAGVAAAANGNGDDHAGRSATTRRPNGGSRWDETAVDLPVGYRDGDAWETAILGPEAATPGTFWGTDEDMNGSGGGADGPDGGPAGPGASPVAAEGGGRGAPGGDGPRSAGTRPGPTSTSTPRADPRLPTADDPDLRPDEQEPREGRL